MKKIKIIQVIPTLAFGDAVSNNTINVFNILKKSGYETYIYAEHIDYRLKKIAKHISKLKKVKKDDIIIYVKSTGSDLSFKLEKFKCKKIMRYHNITPANFFKNYNETAYENSKYGRIGLKYAQKYIDYVLADSEYNKKELLELGYRNVEVLPILISFNDYEKKPDKKILNKYKDEKTNILFVGRIVPNKKQEDIIKTFYYYKKYVNNNSRLIFVGNDSGFESYSRLLKKLVRSLDLEDVIFTGHISFSEILAYYHLADLFLCMSEHEGFCVPLVESMYFEIPIISYNSSAIEETLGDSGILVNKKDYFLLSELMDLVLSDENLRKAIIGKQKKRLEFFRSKEIENKFLDFIKNIH